MQNLIQLAYSPEGDGGGGQEPSSATVPAFTTTSTALNAEQLAEELKKVRAEAAKHRTEKQALAAQVADLAPKAQRLQEAEDAQKTEAQRLADSMAKMQAELQAAQQRAALAEKAAAFTRLAAKAGVQAEVADMLDLSKFDLGNEAEVIEKLQKLAPTQPPAPAGKPSAPGGAKADAPAAAASYFRRAGQGVERIFGG